MNLFGNNFTGHIPERAGLGSVSLVVLEMGYNNFAGKIPGFIGDLKNLRILKLQIIDLSDNNLFGTILEKLEGLKTLITQPTDGELLGYVVSSMYSGVELSMAYKGKIPSEMTLLKGLAMLNLSHNALSGEIPSNIGDMIGLKLTRSEIQQMNLPYNNLSGKIPAGTRFNTLYGDGLAYTRNEHLCGCENLINCNDNTSSSSEETASVEDSIDRLLSIGVVVSGYGVGFWGYFGVLCLIKEQHIRRY
ncbi:serine-threonine protein kinase, plant-type, putative [Ricinus communis]|uniref:Serine-threonine protein kinase, plant-type, putative n=1 Tax=Ricinus communis TaxID=3988 RepID=B9T686_RICCO|nr:serine-threonine protein kinase, plant-type, putative [Ricinus communis]